MTCSCNRPSLGHRDDWECEQYLVARLIPKIKVSPSGCWIWQGAVNNHGYPRVEVTHNASRKFAHRVIYQLGQEIQEGLTLHHRCEVRACVNPDHMVPMTQSDHSRLHHANKPECRRGHAMTEENTVHEKTGYRRCRICYERYKRSRRKNPNHYRPSTKERRLRLERVKATLDAGCISGGQIKLSLADAERLAERLAAYEESATPTSTPELAASYPRDAVSAEAA